MEIQIGNIIKSFDFAFNTTCFTIGRVTSVDDTYINYDCMTIISDSQLVDHTKCNCQMRTPKMGCMMSDDRFERVVVLG